MQADATHVLPDAKQKNPTKPKNVKSTATPSIHSFTPVTYSHLKQLEKLDPYFQTQFFLALQLHIKHIPDIQVCMQYYKLYTVRTCCVGVRELLQYMLGICMYGYLPLCPRFSFSQPCPASKGPGTTCLTDIYHPKLLLFSKSFLIITLFIRFNHLKNF